MMQNNNKIIIIILLFIFQSLIQAQGISEPLTKGHYELGYSHYWYKGDFYWNPENVSNEDTWNNGTVYFRMGLYDIITSSVEFMIWPVTSSSNYPGESFLNYTFGMSLSTPSINLIILDAFINLHYLENMYLDRSEQKNDKRFREIQIALPFRYQLLKHYAIWIAPVYLWNNSVYFEGQDFSRSRDTAGISFGLDALLFKHIYVNLNIQYTNYYLPNIVAGYRF
jgi:hypothetical protein